MLSYPGRLLAHGFVALGFNALTSIIPVRCHHPMLLKHNSEFTENMYSGNRDNEIKVLLIIIGIIIGLLAMIITYSVKTPNFEY